MIGEFSNQCGTGGRHQFLVSLDTDHRYVFQQFADRRSGQGQGAMGAVDESPAQGQGRTVDRCKAKQMKAGHGADNVDDGVEGAYFMEVNFIDGFPVHFCLGPGQSFEDRQRPFGDGGLEPASFKNISDGGKISETIIGC